MKDKIKIISLALLLIISCIAIYLKTNQNDSIKFKNEYESLNNKDNSKGKKYLSININKDNTIKYASFKEIENILTTGTGIIYFGFPECPWCQTYVKYLNEVAKEVGVEKIYYYNILEDRTNDTEEYKEIVSVLKELSKIYYFNAYEIRDKKYLDESNEIITEKEGTKEYKKLIEIMYDELGEYEGLNDQTIKRLYFPTVVFIKDGKIINTHIGTLDEQEDPYTPLTEKQKDTLKNIYKTNILKIKDTECNDKC